MGTTADKLAKLAETKEAIRTAIESKGVEVSTSEPFSAYPEKINAIAGGVGRSLITINVTLDGAANRITEGATISVTNNATGEVVERVWDGSTIQITVESLSEYSIKCSKITSYSSPKKVTFIPANGVSYDYTLDYITPPVGVYLLTTDDELIAPAEWNGSYQCVGVYVGVSSSVIPYSRYVLAPEAVNLTTGSVNESRYNKIIEGARAIAKDEYGYTHTAGSEKYHGLSNTKYIVSEYTALSEAWNYPFKNGAQGFVASLQELLYVVVMNRITINEAYSAIGVQFPYAISYTDTNNWYITLIHSSTPVRKKITAGTTTLYQYGWAYGGSSLTNATETTIPFSIY